MAPHVGGPTSDWWSPTHHLDGLEQTKMVAKKGTGEEKGKRVRAAPAKQ